MTRSYRHIEKYEAELLKMKSEGKTRKEICEALGFSITQLYSLSRKLILRVQSSRGSETLRFLPLVLFFCRLSKTACCS